MGVVLKLLGAGAASAAVVVWFLVTYKREMLKGKNSLGMRVLGRKRAMDCLALLQWLLKSSRLVRNRFDEALRREAEEKCRILDRKAMGEENGGEVAFIGSSTFTFWVNLENDMQPYQTYNAAFGGSCTTHVLEFTQKLAIKRKPSVCVYYCGTNDIANGCTDAGKIADGFIAFFEQVRAALPNTAFVYVSIRQTPIHRSFGSSRINLIKKTNAIVREFCDKQQKTIFVDVETADFVMDENYFLYDGQHFNPEGHKRLASHILQALDSLQLEKCPTK